VAGEVEDANGQQEQEHEYGLEVVAEEQGEHGVEEVVEELEESENHATYGGDDDACVPLRELEVDQHGALRQWLVFPERLELYFHDVMSLLKLNSLHSLSHPGEIAVVPLCHDVVR